MKKEGRHEKREQDQQEEAPCAGEDAMSVTSRASILRKRLSGPLSDEDGNEEARWSEIWVE